MARRQLRFGRRRSSNRLLALIALVFIFTLTIAPPAKNYFTQRAQINALKSQLSADNSALQKAREELLLWQDPEFIKSVIKKSLIIKSLVVNIFNCLNTILCYFTSAYSSKVLSFDGGCFV